jgi:hypothetical protein
MNGRASTVTAAMRPGSAPAEHGSGAGPATNADQSTKDWPLRSYLELGALPSAVPCARLHAKHMLWEWGLDSITDSVELIVSELTTNALAASVGLIGSHHGGQRVAGAPPVRLWLCSDKQRVLVQVWDGDDHFPEPQDVDPLAEGGRGLVLVESLSEEWGTYVPERSSGKVVWAYLARAKGKTHE